MVKESTLLFCRGDINEELAQRDKLLEESCLVTKTDAQGKIIYANDKFLKASGYTLDEVLGQTHNIVSSGFHSKEFWREMYEVVARGEIWHNKRIINKRKDGSFFYVRSWIQAQFSCYGELIGYIGIKHDVTDLVSQQNEIKDKKNYLDHAAKILRHDMHSGINIYIPRGIRALKRRLPKKVIQDLKLEAPLKLLEDGLKHTQRIYKGIYEFTNLVKPNSSLELKKCNLKDTLEEFLSHTSYSDQVYIRDLPEKDVNESLFCTAIDNLIRNGLKYNDSPTKVVNVFYLPEEDSLVVQDNGRGISQEEFNRYIRPYSRKKDQKENGTGLGLNICVSILEQHGFDIKCQKIDPPRCGTILKIKFT